MKNSESRRTYQGLPKLLSRWYRQHGSRLFSKLQASVAIASILSAYVPLPAMAQQAQPAANAAPPAPGLPPAPVPNYTQPLSMHTGNRDFSKPHQVFPNYLKTWEPITVAAPVTSNSQRLEALVHNGKIYLSLADAIVLGLENNFDIAIQRYNLDIADTELLRARAGSGLLGVPAGLVQGTQGGTGNTSSSLTSGGGPGGTSTASGGAAAGAGGINVSTNGQGPVPEVLDPVLTGTLQLERTTTPQPNPFGSGGPTLNQNPNTYNFNYNQGFVTGTQLQVAFNNNRTTSDSIFSSYSPQLQSTFRATVTQHLLNGFGPGINGRFILEAKNNRHITDSAFRLQILYTINQIENIYWVLVSDYEDVQARQRALEQSTRLASDNRKQLQIGTLAPLDVLNADNQVSTDTQALITSQTTLEYQQLIMKQAISRDLSDPALSGAPVIPTDRVSLLEMPEERTPVEDLVQKAYANRPEIEQNILALRNDEITLRATKNNLLPSVDLYGFYGAAALGGSKSPFCSTLFFGPVACEVPTVGYGTVFTNLFNSSGPDKGAGVNVNVPLRNRTAQSLQARALLEYRQAEMRLQQLYIQVRIQVINGQYALTNDRAAVQAALAAREYNYQSYQSEVKKLRLGASTTANVLQQERNLATAENNVISTEATYAKDRASLEQLLAETLDQYGIQLSDAVKGTVTKDPIIPGLEPAKAAPEANVPGQQQQLQHTEHMPPLPVMPTQPKLTPQEQQNLPPEQNTPAPNTPPATPPQ
ncbi:MAG: outer membrane protein [Acidobacteriaceae bacterium]|jgi:outer membrane protein|nr:outer membrane protein [Acidobacteriaceae bacterium]